MAAPSMVPASRDGTLALSLVQERLWFLDHLYPGSPLSTISCAYRLQGGLDVAALERALGEILCRHEALRTRFVSVAGRPQPVIDPPEPVVLVEEDLTTSAAPVAGARRLADAEAQRPFDLARDPLLRVRLLRLGTEDHVLTVTTHRMASDDWSRGVLAGELGALYRAFAAGRRSPLAPLSMQYADVAAWQRSWIGGERLERQLAYWRRQLASMPPALELPTDHPRPPGPSRVTGTVEFGIADEVVGRLRSIGRDAGATLRMTLLGAFQVLVARYARTDDVVVGSPVAGRDRPELEGLIGCFANTVVMRTDCSGDPSFAELLARVRDVALEAARHRHLPFDQLVEGLDPVRDLSRNPLVQVQFEHSDSPPPSLRLAGVEVSDFTGHLPSTRLDLELHCTETTHGISGRLAYAADLFERPTMERLVEQFGRLVEQVAAEPRIRLSELELLSAAERHQLLVEWNDTATPFPEQATISGLVEDQVARDPAAVAVVHEDRSLTYGELNARSNQLAHRLRSLGVGPEVVVGLCLPRGIDMVVGLLAILKAGGAYLPLDPDLPSERLGFMLDDAGGSVVVTLSSLGVEHGFDVDHIVALDADRTAIDTLPTDSPPPLAEPDNLAYIIYTSGSTGQPKGVAIGHRGVVNLLTTAAGRFSFGVGDTWTMFHSFAFDFSVWELWGALTSGGRLVIVPMVTTRSPALLAALIRQERVTVLSVTPQVFQSLSETSGDEWTGELRLVVFGGAALMPVHLHPWIASGPHRATLVNMYGITETTVHSTAWTLPGDDTRVLAEGPIPIGRPMANTEVYVLDDRLRPVPVGVPGELCVGGVGLARGYLGRPTLTADRFVPNPFRTSGSRLYRSGDLARYRPDGTIEYLGRLDDQVKIRGFRIELGEVEAAIAEQPGVRQVAVMAREDAPGDLRLVAYVVHEADRTGRSDELRSALRRRLPEYMVPAAFVALERLPLTANGKVDRRALPVPSGARPELDNRLVVPRTRTEEVLAAVWAEVLGVDEVGVEDNFFDLGGHSLLAVQVVARAAASGVDLTLVDLFERPSIRQVAAGLSTTTADAEPARSSDRGGGPRRRQVLPAGAVRGAYRRWIGGRDRDV